MNGNLQNHYPNNNQGMNQNYNRQIQQNYPTNRQQPMQQNYPPNRQQPQQQMQQNYPPNRQQPQQQMQQNYPPNRQQPQQPQQQIQQIQPNYSNSQMTLTPQSRPNPNAGVVAHPSALQKAGMNIQKIKKVHKDIADDVIKTIESATHQERDAVKNAIQNLRNKEKQVMESSEVKQKVERMETIGDQLENQMSQIKIAYNRAIQELKKICSTQEEFYQKLKDLDDKMEEALLNDEERKMMKAIKGQLQASLGGKLGGGNVRMIMM